MSKASGIRAGRAFIEIGGDSTPFYRAINAAQKGLRDLGFEVSRIGRNVTLGGAGMIAGFVPPVKQFAEFEQAMARVKALTNATGEQFQSLEGLARKLGAETIFTATDAANAMSAFAMAGYDVQTIMGAVGPTLDLAAAGQIEIAEASDISAKIMAGMGIKVGELGHAIDVLTKAMTTANTDLRMLGTAFKYVGPAAKAAGISFEETAAAVQILSNAGIQSEMAGTTLRGFLMAITDPSVEAKKQMDALGISVADAAGNVRPLADIVEQFNKALSGMGTAAKLDAIGTIFDNRQAVGAVELFDRGADKLRDMTAALQGSKGSAARIAAMQLDTLRGSTFLLTSALEGLFIQIGETLSPALRSFAKVATDAINATTQWAKENPGLVASIASLGVTITGVGIAIGALGLSLTAAGIAIMPLSLAMTAVVSTFVGLKMAAAALLTPLGIAAATIAGIVAAALYASDGLAEFGRSFEKLGGIVKTTFDGMLAAFKAGDMELAAAIMWKGLHAAWLAGTMPLRKAWHAFWSSTTNVAIDTVAMLQTAWSSLWEIFRTTTVSIGAAIVSTWHQITWSFRDSWEAAIGWVTEKLINLAENTGVTAILGLDADALRAANDEETANARANREAARNRSIADIQGSANARNDELSREGAAYRQEVKRLRDAAKALNDDDLSAALDGVIKEFEQAEKELADAKNRAAGPGELFGPPDELFRTEPQKPAVRQMEKAVTSALAMMGSSRLTFDVGNLQSLQGPNVSVMKSIEKNTKETADGVRKLNDKAGDGGVWG